MNTRVLAILLAVFVLGGVVALMSTDEPGAPEATTENNETMSAQSAGEPDAGDVANDGSAGDLPAEVTAASEAIDAPEVESVSDVIARAPYLDATAEEPTTGVTENSAAVGEDPGRVTITVKKRDASGTQVAVLPAAGAEDTVVAPGDGASTGMPTGAQPAAPAVPKPTFDIVRVEKSGETVVAGRAPPGTVVALMDGEREIGTATADARGEFVILPEQPLSPQTHELALAAKAPDGRAALSDDVVVVVVPAPAETGPGAAPASEGVVAVLTPRGGDGASRVLQRPSEDAAIPITIDVIDFDSSGTVTVGGRAAPETVLQVYLNDAPAGQGQAREDGVFSVQMPSPVSVGQHDVRVDQIAPDGKVLARAEAPFSRTAMAAELPPGKFVVVLPGNSLWQIARRTYGEGVRYTVIYGANDRQIRDPDLIYPGQIFIVPQTSGDTG